MEIYTLYLKNDWWCSKSICNLVVSKDKTRVNQSNIPSQLELNRASIFKTIKLLTASRERRPRKRLVVSTKKKYTALDISVNTVQRRPKATLTKNLFISMKNRHEHVNWTIIKWNTVLLSDESRFNFYNSGVIHSMWPPENKRFNPNYTVGTIKHDAGCNGLEMLFWYQSLFFKKN